MVPSGPHATISFRNAVEETVSVTPTTRVEWSVRASSESTDCSGEADRRVSRDTTSSGQRTSWGESPWSSCANSRVADSWAANTTLGLIWDLRNPRAPPPWTAAVVTVPTEGPPSGA